MEDPARNWICINRCGVITAMGIPRRCPYCGTHEMFPTDKEVQIIDKSTGDIIQFVNDGDG